MAEYNLYCDESCHKERDSSLDGANESVMVLGAVKVPINKKHEVFSRIREIKAKYGIRLTQEVKWTKITPSKVDFYIELVDFFFDYSELSFRGLVASKKSLDHKKHNQTYDEWYYKMYWQLLSILDPKERYNIFLDIKDTNGGARIRKLHDVLCNSMYDYKHDIVRQVQLVRSHEVEAMQLTDILIGAISYINRGLSTSLAKQQVIERIRKRSTYSLIRSTLVGEKKFNLFMWTGD